MDQQRGTVLGEEEVAWVGSIAAATDCTHMQRSTIVKPRRTRPLWAWPYSSELKGGRTDTEEEKKEMNRDLPVQLLSNQ